MTDFISGQGASFAKIVSMIRTVATRACASIIMARPRLRNIAIVMLDGTVPVATKVSPKILRNSETVKKKSAKTRDRCLKITETKSRNLNGKYSC